MVAALQAPVWVSWDRRDTVGVGPSHGFEDDVRRPLGEPTQSVLLPGGDDAPHRLVVFDRRSGPGECEAPAGAFRAPPDGPCRRRAAALANRWSDPPQARPAATADLVAREGADQAPLRQQQVEHFDEPRRNRRTEPCRLCA